MSHILIILNGAFVAVNSMIVLRNVYLKRSIDDVYVNIVAIMVNAAAIAVLSGG